jgi:hypothetical protein
MARGVSFTNGAIGEIERFAVSSRERRATEGKKMNLKLAIALAGILLAGQALGQTVTSSSGGNLANSVGQGSVLLNPNSIVSPGGIASATAVGSVSTAGFATSINQTFPGANVSSTIQGGTVVGVGNTWAGSLGNGIANSGVLATGSFYNGAAAYGNSGNIINAP